MKVISMNGTVSSEIYAITFELLSGQCVTIIERGGQIIATPDGPTKEELLWAAEDNMTEAKRARQRADKLEQESKLLRYAADALNEKRAAQ